MRKITNTSFGMESAKRESYKECQTRMRLILTIDDLDNLRL